MTSMNPLNAFDNIGTRRTLAGFARHGASALAMWLVSRGWVAEQHSAELVEQMVGGALFVYTLYLSRKNKQYSEKEIAVASALPESTERATIEHVASTVQEGA